jgi:uncharacterized protein (TIGR02300 family)
MTLAAALGQKHICEACSAKFYDMGKKQPACPKCGAVVVEAVSVVLRPIAKPQPQKPKAKADDGEGMEVFKGGEIDTIDTMEDDEDILVSLSELEDRESSDRAEVDDDVHEEDLMEETAQYGTILDSKEEHGEEEARG